MTPISASNRQVFTPRPFFSFQRFLGWLVEADHAYREKRKLDDLPGYRRDDMGLPSRRAVNEERRAQTTLW